MTHRLFSRNAASSRAIPISKFIERVMTDPAEPVFWGKNQRGMQALEELDEESINKARSLWFEARDRVVDIVRYLEDLGLHKQISNRLLEPWLWMTTIISSTEWENFFNLRRAKEAQPEIKLLADMIFEEMEKSTPRKLEEGDWHLPLWDDDVDRPALVFQNSSLLYGKSVIEVARKVAVGRCARVSYLTHDGKRDLLKDVELHDQLLQNGHWSPFEHVARALAEPVRIGNFVGWKQYRKEFEHEHPTQIEQPYVQGSVILTPKEASALARMVRGAKADPDELEHLDSAKRKLRIA